MEGSPAQTVAEASGSGVLGVPAGGLGEPGATGAAVGAGVRAGGGVCGEAGETGSFVGGVTALVGAAGSSPAVVAALSSLRLTLDLRFARLES